MSIRVAGSARAALCRQKNCFALRGFLMTRIARGIGVLSLKRKSCHSMIKGTNFPRLNGMTRIAILARHVFVESTLMPVGMTRTARMGRPDGKQCNRPTASSLAFY
ncbi:MAG: hypothetical protein HY046_08290 [Acidobacteria bacterium]|nr:hypothetical protein [Acidobacteriota bacterium]